MWYVVCAMLYGMCGVCNVCGVCACEIVYVCEGVGTGPERVCPCAVSVWECLGLVVCSTGGCVGPRECQVTRECVCRSESGADVSVRVCPCVLAACPGMW